MKSKSSALKDNVKKTITTNSKPKRLKLDKRKTTAKDLPPLTTTKNSYLKPCTPQATLNY